MRERAFAKGWQKNTLEARKMRLKREFSPPQNGQNKMKNEVFLLEKRQKFRNNLTHLHNIKTKQRGRAWKNRRESIAFKDTILRKYNFH